MLIGTWKNFDHLERSLTLDELELVLQTYRDQRMEDRRFAAALKGIDIDAENNDSEEAVRRAKVRAEARLRGENPEHAEFADMGLMVEED